MPRRRKITGTARVVVEGPLLPPFPPGTWRALEEAIGMKLNRAARGAVRRERAQYADDVRHIEAAANRAALLGRIHNGNQKEPTPLTHLNKALANCVVRWDDAMQDDDASWVLIEFGSDVQVKTRGKIELDTLRLNLTRISGRLNLWLKELASGMGEEPDPFRSWVRRVEKIIEGIGGDAGPSRNPYQVDCDQPKTPTQFHKFMKVLNDSLPGEFRKPSHSVEAFYSKVNEARR